MQSLAPQTSTSEQMARLQPHLLLLLPLLATSALAARKLRSPFATADPKRHPKHDFWLLLALAEGGRGPAEPALAEHAASTAARQLLQGQNPGLPLDQQDLRDRDFPPGLGRRSRDPDRFRAPEADQGEPCVDCRTCRRFDARCRAICSAWCPRVG